MYQVRSFSTGKPLNFRLCDTRGLEESQGIDAHDIAHLIDGQVPDGYQVYFNNPKSKLPHSQIGNVKDENGV